nr:sigma-70 family RNA polymerase sigma factor [Marivivens niveibacter]
MFVQSETQIQDGPVPVDHYGQGQNHNVRTKRKPSRVPNTDTSQRIAWIEEIFAIRDKQDQAAFARLFAHFAPRIKGFLIRSGAADDMAEECAQEVLATVWRKAALFDPSRASAATWIFTIARNRQIDMIRRARRPEPEDLPWGPDAEPDQEDVIALSQETEKLGEAIAALPEKQRELIERAYFGDLSHSEIAEQTGLPLGTIKSRIRLALDRLRHSMR